MERRYIGHNRPEFGPVDLDRLSRAGAGAKGVTFTFAGGAPLLLIRDGTGERRLDLFTMTPVEPDREMIRGLAALAAPMKRIAAMERLERSDIYWYSHWNERPLPVWRVRFADAEQTWLHIDARTGMLLGQSTAEARTYRWLFNFLHDFDLPILLDHRWVRDPLMWLLLTFGTILSATGVVIGWRRLRRPRPASVLPLRPSGQIADFSPEPVRS